MNDDTEIIAKAEIAAAKYGGNTPLAQFTQKDWIRFAANYRLSGELTPVRGAISVTAVNMMAQTMADHSADELARVRTDAFNSMIASLQSFCDSELGATESADKAGVLRAIEIVRRSV